MSELDQHDLGMSLLVGGHKADKPKSNPRKRSRRGAICELPDCEKRATFGDEMKKYRWCASHRLPGSKCFQVKLCEYPQGCDTTASYCLEHGGKKRWCSAHKPPGAFIKGALKCVVADCNKQPTFGHPGEGRKWCSLHKLHDTVNLTKRSCADVNCSVRATYVHLETNEKYCVNHAPEGAIEVRSKRKTSADELLRQLLYVEGQNNKLRRQLKSLRAIVEPSKLKAWDRENKLSIHRDKKDKFQGGQQQELHEGQEQSDQGLDSQEQLDDTGMVNPYLHHHQHQNHDDSHDIE
mmetsp:Transcript_11628/g.18923  ORF Transcript_11628/g.18923 Transcript_11628/m.18923 type:complete len:293 (-) Transcript_11628:2335-3213(-)|eukprot:CAMPEP_0203774334 /NCGR_PEP_ID=MMETSP0099_2-20121227/5243_1 /ASSEMBLY_ACC=CAM_ASM_000209 /TAXON_ID=96639 /ORGANISM=" , Strain NY0313808BC1" /LENGTH=292 /DNA_ID=CAMNT_0050672439 /DNA_START=45 /DNA_END=923 /DNA_ORIENTATION=-